MSAKTGNLPVRCHHAGIGGCVGQYTNVCRIQNRLAEFVACLAVHERVNMVFIVKNIRYTENVDHVGPVGQGLDCADHVDVTGGLHGFKALTSCSLGSAEVNLDGIVAVGLFADKVGKVLHHHAARVCLGLFSGVDKGNRRISLCALGCALCGRLVRSLNSGSRVLQLSLILSIGHSPVSKIPSTMISTVSRASIFFIFSFLSFFIFLIGLRQMSS